ncbi:MAG: hypothetical protein J1E34_03505 [Oscillospiraceae bacterium]|nr:hypothetical protein [Oscillospiraceae bacterium]
MKKIVSLILCFTLLLPVAVLPAFAAETNSGEASGSVSTAASLESAFAEGENSLIIFVTGIGQSFSYLFDKTYTQPGAFENGTLQDYENWAPLIAEGKYLARWNLFSTYLDEAFDKSETKSAIAKLVLQIISMLLFRKNTVEKDDVRTVISNLFAFNLVDENGNSNERVVTPRYACALSEYPGVTENGKFRSEAKDRFYGSIPCADIAREKLGENYEDYLYCFNYNAFSYTSKNVNDLHSFIETVLENNKVGAEKVVLVPMSMGASVVSAYLAAYPNVSDNHVRRVVSIVGAWNGSDVALDLITQNYADNSADLLYNGIIADLVGEPWGYLVNFALRLFSKTALRSFIDDALGVFVDVMFLHTPSLIALIPDYGYEQVRPMITSEAVLKEADEYGLKTQPTLKSRLEALEEQGVTFSFISGYGLPFGAQTSDYNVFGFMHSAELTNGDEVINISSTSPGTEFVPYSETFSDTEGRVLSPEGSIDIANTYYKDSSWYFYQQKHELEYNNTALSLAINLALGSIKTVSDCDNLEEDGVYYPQFNGARNIRSLKNTYIPEYEAYIASGGQVTDRQAAVYEAAKAMMNSTVNDFSSDNAVIADFFSVLVDLGIEKAPSSSSGFNKFLNTMFKSGNSFMNCVFGSKGFLDFTK